MRIAIITLTLNGLSVARAIKENLDFPVQCCHLFTNQENSYPEVKKISPAFHPFVKEVFNEYDALIFILACGIVVRSIASLMRHKSVDPAVLVIDEMGRNVISLLSGHLGGANRLTEKIAALLSANPVITTASDLQQKISVDMLAKQYHCYLSSWEKAKDVTALLVNGQKVALLCEEELPEKKFFCSDQENRAAEVILSNRKINLRQNQVQLIPRNLIIGIGCRKGVAGREIEDFIKQSLNQIERQIKSVACLVTIDLKKEEKGLIEAACQLNIPLNFIPADQIRSIENRFKGSRFVQEAVGVKAVAEPCAFLGSNQSGRLLQPKITQTGISLAIWEEKIQSPVEADFNAGKDSHQTTLKEGAVFVLGIGPGDARFMSSHCHQVLNQADLVIGYQSYLDCIKELIAHKEKLAFPMRKEADRCRAALQQAEAGKKVALISSGDAGVYGMAGLMLEIIEQQKSQIKVEIVAGITAAQSASALLGAPLMHDFAVISLSDLLTSWQEIKNRVQAAGRSNFVIVLYNPKSKKRITQIRETRQILLQYRAATTPVGIVRNAGRKNCSRIITCLEKMTDHTIDMLTTIIIGNRETKVINGKMVTPRGYPL